MDDNEADIHDLLIRHRAGDNAATDTLVGVACRRLERMASRMLASFPDVARWERTGDVIQGAMIRLHKALAGVRLESPQHFWNLAGQTVRRELLNLAAKYRGQHGFAVHHHSDGGAAVAGHAGEPRSVEGWAELLELVEKLPDDVRAVFDLLVFQQMGQEQAAIVLGVSVRTVKRRWLGAKLALRAMRPEGEL